MDEKKQIRDVKNIENGTEVQIQNTDVDIDREEENPGVGYEIVTNP